MSSPTNDLFKFISLRQPSEDSSIDPAKIVSGSIAIELLQNFQVNIDNPQQEVLAQLKAVSILTAATLRGLTLEQAAVNSLYKIKGQPNGKNDKDPRGCSMKESLPKSRAASNNEQTKETDKPGTAVQPAS